MKEMNSMNADTNVKTAIKATNISKSFMDGELKAVEHFTFSVEEGTVLGLVGENGAGKSTLLRMLAGVYEPDEGTVTVGGKNVYKNSSARNDIAYVPDDPYYHPRASVRYMGEIYSSLRPTFSVERYNEICERFGLEQNTLLRTMSKGQRRQVAIALGLSIQPKYLIIDETFDGLDSIKREIVKNLIFNDVSERGMTAVVASHSLREVDDFCDKLAIVKDGKLLMASDIQSIASGIVKVQVAFLDAFDSTRFSDIGEILTYKQSGKVAEIVVRGTADEVTARVNALQPAMADILPLNIEEVFAFENQTGDSCAEREDGDPS